MPADLPSIRARLAAATPGPWEYDGGRCVYVPEEYRFDGEPLLSAHWKPNAALIAHAPADLAALCDEVEALRAEVERLRGVVSSKPRVCQDCRTTGNFHGSLTHCACGGRLG